MGGHRAGVAGVHGETVTMALTRADGAGYDRLAETTIEIVLAITAANGGEEASQPSASRAA
jgi:hypothetical protein